MSNNYPYDVAVVPCENYDENTVRTALSDALDSINGLDFVYPGIKIAIKVNLVAAKRPETATTTHPALVCELVKMLVARGATVVVGDSPGGLYNNVWLSGIYQATGMSAVEAVGAKLNRNFSQTTVKNPSAHTLHEFTFTSYLAEADAIIDFSKLKTHGMMVMSAAVKNMFGAIPGTTKPEYHCMFPTVDSFGNMLIDLYEYFRPTLCITDAVYGMEGNGPTAGTPRYIGALIVSKSGHFADLAGACLMGLDPDRVPLLSIANERGLCPDSIDELNIYGDTTDFIVKDYKLITEASGSLSAIFPKPLVAVVEKVFRTRPTLIKDKCVGCEKCFNTCPKHAISMKNGKPVFDYKKCIRCFCCQEFCPKGALVVRRSHIAKAINKG